MKIAVCGYYGMGNFGDELFLLTFRQQLSGHSVFAWHSAMDPSVPDAVLIGGGDLIAPYSFNSYYFPPALEGKPTWVYGAGIVDAYPESTWPDREIERYRKRLRDARGLFLRDDRSAQIARRIALHSNVQTVPDPVFAYRAPDYKLRGLSARPVIGVCVHAYSGFPAAGLASMLAHISREGYHILLIPAVNHSANAYSDYGVCDHLKERILELGGPGASASIFKPEYELELVYRVIQACDYFISFKLHPALAALRGLVPLFCVSKQGKVASLLDRFGLRDRLETDESALDRLEAGIRRMLKEGREPIQAAEPAIRQTEKEAEEAFAALRRELDSVGVG
ncbi:polysaccharide pyruvyl transferase family protein [Gorillibacterium sp. sgz500922]|uniref:polysaccharide pyruvyl transferase family protein n=1 Tax=Gorillibacterium sp. sgz500922 TaxID=3446694 RepID=UPI003F666A57